MIELDSVDGHPDGQIDIASRRLESGVVLVVTGEIDLATVPTVERELLHAEESHDVVAIDLSKVSFIDSAGVHMIVAANRRLRERGGRLLIVQGPAQVSRLFELTGLSDYVEVVRDQTELERSAD